ncbi:cadherin-23-like [Centruroides sculpturatus]|uniref:cadherin-23-like n=1 Tax=Centruroides sculpturatus TaxID=218467 RepID=UPI000C6E57C9|nr:cadherin-23-like [Centruroides sculpturatus]XP_023233385.1 cadherin-23-like [Centruroides sculpturatus]
MGVFSLVIYVGFLGGCWGQINRAPVFLPGGDMSRFSLREDTPVGSSVYTLRGRDPENTRVYYYISGGSFSVNKDTGVVHLIRPLDREIESSIDVIISITDEKVQGQDPNTISLKREITVLDQNDNPPRFQNVPYAFVMEEMTPVGTTVYRGILVTDADIGTNAEIKLSCRDDITPDACQKFEIQGFEISAGNYRGEIVLKENVDYEEKSTYTMIIMAEDLSLHGRLNSTVNVIVEIKDIQDQSPVFHNAPYSATVSENSLPGTSVLTVSVHDGDIGNPRPLILMTQQDKKKYFRLNNRINNGQGLYSATLETSNVPIDREDPDILNNGGLYIFQIKAIELINGRPIGDSVISNVTIVVTDINDQQPEFNEKQFNVTVSEDISNNTPLPDLNMVVSDMDVGDNAKFSLHLEDVLNSNGVFSVFPTTAIGRTPVIIKVIDTSKLDYEHLDKQMFIFHVIASQQGMASTTSTVTVHLSDANDNSPIFKHEQYVVKVPENAPANATIFSLQAQDADSGIFGKIKYSIKGFGSDKFKVDTDNGHIKIANCGKKTCLDYEMQKDYSLTYEAEDGGGKVSSVNLFIEVLDINDNPPQFLKDEYICELQENAKEIIPPLFVKATDLDSSKQDGDKIIYSIKAENTTDPVISIDPTTGQIMLKRPIKFSDTPNNSGLLFVMIQAKDYGNPPLLSETRLLIKLKRENDGAPLFLGEPYKVSIKENAPQDTSVIKIVATDPDGPDNKITYAIESGGKDSFVIDSKTGIIRVISGANLDRDIYGTEYKLIVHAIDAGNALQQTATATVTILIDDVNNKPPKFLKDTYVQYIPENLNIGEEVINVTAIDPDKDAKLRYSIIEPIIARDKTGSVVSSTDPFNYKNVFRIDGTTGQITINSLLDYSAASVIILTAQVIDLNAVVGTEQKATVEVTVYVQVHNEMVPIFAPPWTPSNPKIDITVPEETLIGSTLLTLAAYDPLAHQAINHFEKVSNSDSNNYVSVSPISGLVTLNHRLDFEELPLKYITFQVKAINGDDGNERFSTATVVVNVQDVNDNSPVFSQDSYKTTVSESATYPHTLLTVLASDKDSGEFGNIEYSVSGDGSDVFDIDKKSGTIQIRENITLDREKQASYNLQVIANDSPNIIANQRRTSVLVVISLLDVNDNAPVFSQPLYTAVVPENVPTDFSIITVKATDADEGRNKEIQYTIVEDMISEPVGYFSVDFESGVVSVIRALTGKGREEPYSIIIRATDKGIPAKYTDVEVLVIVSDVSTNDGIPQFIRPASGEVAYIHENATLGTPVFQVVAFDPDNPNTANGKVSYRFLDDHTNSIDGDFAFAIDSATGVISTQQLLDRETKENYTIIVVAYDYGFPPQEAHRVLRVYILDVDDNDPHFNRPIKSQPIDIKVKEEQPIGTVIGSLQGIDEDVGINAIMDYFIIDGNEQDVFGVRRNNESKGEIYINKHIDREKQNKYLLTIKVSKPSKPPHPLQDKYTPEDLSQIQVAVDIQDIDDNPPLFEKDHYIVGVRESTEVDAELVTVKASDPDSSSGPVMYSIKNVTYFRSSKKEVKITNDNFVINPSTGKLNANQGFQSFVNGYFDILIEARSGPGRKNVAYAHVKVYVLYDGDLLKFVFDKRPDEVRNNIPQFKKDLETAITEPLTLNIYDTQFYSRSDGSLDFESTSSCFQLLEKDDIVDPKRVMDILNAKKSAEVEKLYKMYKIVSIEQCIPSKEDYRMTWSEVSVLVVAALIAVSAFVVTVIICIMYSRYKKKIRLMYYHNMIVGEQSGPLSTLSPAEQQRIYEWQEMNTPMADAASFRSYPTLR